jgi:hypothetical protein
MAYTSGGALANCAIGRRALIYPRKTSFCSPKFVLNCRPYSAYLRRLRVGVRGLVCQRLDLSRLLVRA